MQYRLILIFSKYFKNFKALMSIFSVYGLGGLHDTAFFSVSAPDLQ